MVIRAPSLDTDLGPAVQYWVLDAPVPGRDRSARPVRDLVRDHSRDRPGLRHEHAAELITGLVGAPVEHELLASDPWTARMLIADRFSDRPGVPGRGERAREPALGRPRLQHLGRRRGQHRLEDRGGLQGWAPERLLASYEPERRGVVEKTVASAASHLSKMAGDLPPRRGRDPAGEGSRVLQPRPGPRLLLRRIAGHPAVGRPAGRTPTRRHQPTRPTTEPGARLPHCLAAGRDVALRPPRSGLHPAVPAAAGRGSGGRRGAPAAGPRPPGSR